MLNRSCGLGLHSVRNTSGQRLKDGVSLSILALLVIGFRVDERLASRNYQTRPRPGLFIYKVPVGTCLTPAGSWMAPEVVVVKDNLEHKTSP